MNLKKRSLQVAAKNTSNKNIRKSIEELTELSLELLHKLNKPHKDNNAKIIKEIADVEIRMLYLKKTFGKAAIKTAMDKKLKTIESC
jgi:NTP pyrophosphatase (non-canonical NTP hydrolase)|tara:strand:+ start:4217 stop:4477 length:261 start_codon:yes stop_codon:yes gene_type:complete